MKILIKNAKIISPYEVKDNSSLEIEKGKISNLFHKRKVDEEGYDRIIDAKNQYLSPGFIDIHNHGNSGYDAMDGSYQALDAIAEFHLQNGITSFLATTMTSESEKVKRALENVGKYINEKEHKNIKSQVLGIYLEGPYFAMEKKGAQPAEYIRLPDIEEMEEFINISQDTIKVVALAPELDGAEQVISYLRSKDIRVAAGHSNANFAETKIGIDAGITIATHLYNGMRSFAHREPGIIGAVLTDDRVFTELISDGIHSHLGAMDLAVRAKGKEKIVLISDAMRAAGLEDGEYELGGQAVFVKNGEARLKEGSLAGSVLTLDRAVYNMVNLVNLRIEDAVRMATLNAAKAIGLDKSKGSIEVGKDADLIIFDEDINISKAMVNGEVREFK